MKRIARGVLKRHMASSTPFRVGKLPSAMLESHVLGTLGTSLDSVIVGPAVGEDAAVLRLGGANGTLFAAKADPITGASANIGRLVVHVNANDLAASGAVPTWMLVTALFPAGTPPADVATVSRQVHDTCKELGVAIVGGHTELTDAVTQPVLCGTMLGPLLTKAPIRTAGAQVGNRLVLTKGVALEAMSILCEDRAAALVAASVFESESAARAYGEACGKQLSVVADARVALIDAGLEEGAVTSMHDPTEGGLAGALHELADASGRGFRLTASEIPVASETRRVAQHYGVEPMELISSGALLLCCSAQHVEALLAAYRKAGIVAANIGEILEDSSTRVWDSGNVVVRPEQDALWSCEDKKD